MNKLNLPPFYVGQKVVCVDDKKRDSRMVYVKLGVEYTISGIIQSIFGYSVFVSEAWCDSPLGYYHDRFATLQQQNFPLMTFSKILEKEKEEVLLNN